LHAEPSAAELGAALREHAYLEGDFVLRSGRRSRYYLDKYRFETRPDLLGPLGELIAAAAAEHEPDAARLAGPELGAVPLAAAASLASGGLFGRARRAARHSEPAPSEGAVPAERHAHVSSVSAR
jgi:orotate phosphoribosyltransferase